MYINPNEISTFVSLAGGDGRGADLVVQEGAAVMKITDTHRTSAGREARVLVRRICSWRGPS